MDGTDPHLTPQGDTDDVYHRLIAGLSGAPQLVRPKEWGRNKKIPPHHHTAYCPPVPFRHPGKTRQKALERRGATTRM